MLKKNILNLWNTLNELKTEDTNKTKIFSQKFKYFMARNIKAIEPEIEALSETNQASPEYQQYNDDRMKIIQEYCVKDGDGQLISNNGRYTVIPKFIEVCQEAVDQLDKSYKEVLDKENVRIKEFEEILQTEYEGNSLFKIKLSTIQNDDISTGQFEKLLDCDLIIDDEMEQTNE